MASRINSSPISAIKASQVALDKRRMPISQLLIDPEEELDELFSWNLCLLGTFSLFLKRHYCSSYVSQNILINRLIDPLCYERFNFNHSNLSTLTFFKSYLKQFCYQDGALKFFTKPSKGLPLRWMSTYCCELCSTLKG